jgi:hypothetical protein
MNEIEVLQAAFGFDEPSAAARERARAALVERMAPRRRRWDYRIAVGVAAAAAVAVGAVVVTGVGTDGQRPVTRASTPPVAAAALPYAKPAGATEFLENAAWTAARRAWVDPLPGQFMYVEFRTTENPPEISDAQPNGALVPGQTVQRRRESWTRIDGNLVASRQDGGQIYTRERPGRTQPSIPYGDLAGLTTPEKFDEWHHREKPAGASPELLLTSYVLPPDVEAAIYRWLARQPTARVDLNGVNFDGRPAIALTYIVEDYLRTELLFDPRTYALIGDRRVAVKDHAADSPDGTPARAGDVFRLVVRVRFGIVDQAGDTP